MNPSPSEKNRNDDSKSDQNPKQDNPGNKTFGNKPAVEDPKPGKQPDRYEVVEENHHQVKNPYQDLQG